MANSGSFFIFGNAQNGKTNIQNMPESIESKQIFSLFEVARSIQKTIAERYRSAYWIKAEMMKLNHYIHSGHCYPDLVEKKDGKIIAQIRANIWKEDFIRINQRFEQVIKEPLKDGIKILFLANITYHAEYGISLHITDIDPAFTLGDLEREKQETIKRLITEGIFNHNKNLKFPLLPKRIAIISVESSKGYADFLNVINKAKQQWGYSFFHFLFPSLLQGDKAVETIISQLNRIKKVIHHFDIVTIIRGGGGDIGLSCYNNYLLAKEIALFPIPVLSGIGHATNETAAEMVAHTNAITPTKLAEILIQGFHNFAIPVQKAEEKIKDKAVRTLFDEWNQFNSQIKHFRSVTTINIHKNKAALNHVMSNFKMMTKFMIIQALETIEKSKYRIHKRIDHTSDKEKGKLNSLIIQMEKGIENTSRKNLISIGQEIHKIKISSRNLTQNYDWKIKNIEKLIEILNPYNVMKRGYSITKINGKSIQSIEGLNEGDTVETIVAEGSFESKIEKIKKQ